HRRAERLLVVETHPAATQIVRFMRGPAALDGSRVPERHGVVLPALDRLPHFGGHAARRHRLAGRDLQGLPAFRGADLDVRAADGDDQDAPLWGFSQPPISATSLSACGGPHEPGSYSN